MHRFDQWACDRQTHRETDRQTENRQTNGQIAALLNASYLRADSITSYCNNGSDKLHCNHSTSQNMASYSSAGANVHIHVIRGSLGRRESASGPSGSVHPFSGSGVSGVSTLGPGGAQATPSRG